MPYLLVSFIRKEELKFEKIINTKLQVRATKTYLNFFQLREILARNSKDSNIVKNK